jgi:hypothetical protein
MGWKTVVVIGSVLAAALGGAGWAVAASATGPSPVIGPPLVVSPAARQSPSSAPPSLAPSASHSSSFSPDPPSAPASRTAEARPTRTDGPAAESPETVDPQWVEPVEDDDDGQAGDD